MLIYMIREVMKYISHIFSSYDKILIFHIFVCDSGFVLKLWIKNWL